MSAARTFAEDFFFIFCFVQSSRGGIPDAGKSFAHPTWFCCLYHHLEIWHTVLKRTKASSHWEHVKKKKRKRKHRLWCHLFWQNALSAGIGSKNHHCAFWEQNQKERSGTFLNCQMILQLSPTLGTVKYTFHMEKKKKSKGNSTKTTNWLHTMTVLSPDH